MRSIFLTGAFMASGLLLVGFSMCVCSQEIEPFHTDGLVDHSEKASDDTTSINWHDDYARAVRIAEKQGKMLVIYFRDPGNRDCDRFKSETLDDPTVRSKLQDYVCLQAPLDASIIVDGKKTVLLEHEAFKEMLGKPGVAIIDYRQPDSQVYGTVISTFPITGSLWYTPEKMAVILDLPPGTLTQRTLIYAVRTHPDKPASADGELSPYLLEETRNHS
ncbi:MAG: thioredoxin family protein, partial [Thermoguttaceae bacterium]